MIADLKPYSEYKESGLSWVGQIPRHWEIRRLRYACDLRVSNVDKHMKPGEIPVRLCNYVDVYNNDRIIKSIPFMLASASEDECKRFRLHAGDVLITKDSEEWNDIGIPALVEYEAPDLVCGYHLAICRSRSGLSGQFLHRSLQSHFIASQFHVEANGVTRYGLSHGAIKGIAIPLPPSIEQASIVRFLDWANGRLERAVQAKQKIISLLTEQKQAIIHRVCSCGVDPNVRLKDSGIPWIGDIPEHWEIIRTRYLFREIDERSTTGQERHLSMSQKLGLVPAEEVKSSLQSDSYVNGKVCKIDDLVLNRLKAHLGVFAMAKQDGVISPDYSVFRKIRSLNTKYYELILRGKGCRGELFTRSKGIVEGFWRLYTDDFYDIKLPLPPLIEQNKIVSAIEAETRSIEIPISRLEREISLLREYRTRLISDVVTGKLDVREASRRLPDEAQSEEVGEDRLVGDDETDEMEVR